MSLSESYIYTALEGHDAIRLIILHPSPDIQAPLNIDLVPITLSEYDNEIIDSYTALSYGKSLGRVEAGFLSNVSQLITQNATSSSPMPTSLSFSRLYTQGMSHEIRHLIDKHVLMRPWFYQIWVLQELVLSVDPWLQAGRRRVRWRTFCDYIFNNFHPINLIDKRIHVASAMDLARTQFRPSWLPNLDVHADIEASESTLTDPDLPGQAAAKKLLPIVYSRRSLGVFDPRDMIYGHLGMVQDDKNAFALPQADYQISASQLYTKFAISCLQWTGSLDFLSQVEYRHPDSPMVDLPSWVPNWTSPGPPSDISIPGSVTWTTAAIESLYMFYEPFNSLCCVGSVIDSVKTIEKRPPPYINLDEFYEQGQQDCLDKDHGRDRYFQLLDQIYTRLLSSFYTWLAESSSLDSVEDHHETFSFGNRKPSGDDIVELEKRLLARIVTSSKSQPVPQWMQERIDAIDRPNFKKQRFASEMWSLGPLGNVEDHPLFSTKSVDPLPHILAGMEKKSGNGNQEQDKCFQDWNIALTQGGKAALVPPATVQGDLICELLGNPKAPYILRPIPRTDAVSEMETHVKEAFTERQQRLQEGENKKN
ncbi:hypothetical protein G7Y89_g2800 [Cudoniella acicularis]|uniref:Heterokaryon incompatibility domain-containing protein n=1 Tax=Cudoniella acicularis TaxID=354080 RepID=A0A8H4RSM1_9HELO|nr:hypothetical protein G7Y89_g2800 [Cudoniella acicularis]